MSDRPTHAGAVAFCRRAAQTMYLVVSSSNGLHWVLPKGHIEPRESAEAAALRELREEAGVDGELVRRLSLERYHKLDEAVVVQYFLVRARDRTKATENRSLRWEDEAGALGLLNFEEARNALRKAAAVLREGEKAGDSG